MPDLPEPTSDSLIRRGMRGLAHLMPARADGTNPVAVRAFHRMDAIRERLRRRPTPWPVTSGAYAVGDPTGSLAICVLTSDELYPELARLPGVAIAGRVVVPNLGIEKIVRNVTANPHIRRLLVCGKDSPVFHPGEALRQLHAEGVDPDRRIIGARGHLPVLTNLAPEQIDAFRAQVDLIDLIGETDPARIGERAQELASRPVAPFASGATGVGEDRFAVVRPGGAREPLAYDPHGFFVITTDPVARRIEVLHYLPDNTPGHRISGHSGEAILHGLLRERLISQLSHAGYLGAELAKAETALRLGLEYRQDLPLRGVR
ncbi:MAG: hypothetical protein QM804_05070 [Propionicimonas sp.]